MKKALGKGLSALIPDTYAKDLRPAASADAGTATADQPFEMIPAAQIVPNEDQPRKEFSESGIRALAASIKEKGILQPVVVKRLEDGRYMLICGERRFRAAELCGLVEIPAIVKDVARDELLEWALIENIQREDLNPLEEAEAYRRLAEERMLSQEDIARKVGKDRSTVANTLRLLRLPEDVRAYVADGRLSAGHARALLGMLTPEHQRQMARRIAEENLSVRQVEAIVNRSNAQKRRPRSARLLKPEIADLENQLSRHFGTQVRIYVRKNQKQGRLEIRYFSLDDFDRIIERTGLKLS